MARANRGVWMAVVAALVAGVCLRVSGQQAPPSPPTFRAAAQLVVQTVSVKDKDGKPIEGLTINDFAITEDGEPQKVSFAEFQRLPTIPETGVANVANVDEPPPVSPAPRRATPNPAPTTDAQITTSAPGEIRYRNRRLLIMYFDLTSMPSQDVSRAYNGARKFITTQMTPADLIAVMVFQGGGVRVPQNFTDDKSVLLDVIETIAFGTADATGLADMVTQGSAFGQDDAEFAILNTDRQLSALQTAVEMLRPLPDQKALIYFAGGLQLNGVDNQAQLRATTNAALRANVSIFPVDTRGLVASSPLGNATQASPGGLAMFTGQTAGAGITRFQRSQDTLFSLAKDTGGKAMLDFNDLSMGIVQAARAVQSYYIVGFYTSHAARDGKFHKVKVTVPGRPEAELSTRAGYYADKEFAAFNEVDKERQLEDALRLENPVTDLTIAMEVNYFQLTRAEYFVPVAVKIPGSELALARRRGASRTVIDFIGEVKDEAGGTVQNVRDKVDVKLTDETAAQLARHPVQYETGFTLLPGRYVVKVLARDAETGHIGTYQAAFVIPNLDREQTHVPISSVVLSSQRVPLTDAVFNLQKADVQAANPLVADGQRLVPSVTRVFSKARNLLVFLQAYQRGATTTQPLVSYVTVYNGDRKVLETPPLVITEGLDARTKAVPIRFSIPLETLAPGRYDVQVSVMNGTGEKASFWRGAVVVQ